MTECPSPVLINRYIAGECTPDERREVQAHIAECKTCREKVQSGYSNKAAQDAAAGQIASDSGVGGTSKENRARQDEFPTRSMSGVPDLSSDTRIPAKSLDSMFEGYEVLEELPRGGQAVVYKAIQKATKRAVAVKVLLQGPYASTRAQYRFEREVDLAASLQHPNIVTIYDSGIARGQYYFAMEYVQGKPLEKYVRSEKLPIRETMTLFSKVCSAVAYAHQRGVMHRDLKPSNILVDTDGQPHILDFGLAKLTGGSEQAAPEAAMTSMTGQIIGTLAFMSPEQASGQPSAVDVRTDVYSLGVILYKVLTDSFPYDVDGSTLLTLRNIQEVEPKRPSKFARHLSSDVEAILLKALAKEPAYRYQSAAEMRHDIEYWLKGLPIAARADSSIYLLRKIIARHRYASAVLALLVLIVLGFSYVSLDLYVTAKKSQQESEATAEQSAAQAAKALTLFRQLKPLCFASFLQAWRDGRNSDAIEIALYFFDTDPKGRKAAGFLLNPDLLAKKEADFRRSLSQEHSWFADFIVGEHHLKNGNKQEALKAYLDSYKAIQQLSQAEKSSIDIWLITQIKARVYDLSVVDKAAEEQSKLESGD